MADQPTIKRLTVDQLEAAAVSLRRAINDPLRPSQFARSMLPKIEAELEARRSVPGFDGGVIRVGDRRYQRFNGTWMVQPPMLRGFVPADPVACDWLDEIERLRAAGDGLVAAISNCGCVPSERCGWCIAKDKWQEARRG